MYVGSTDNLQRRVWEHKDKVVPGFTSQHAVDRLGWFESHESRLAAKLREKQIKEWRRNWKIALIERDNPHWIDLYPESIALIPERTARWIPAFAGKGGCRGG